MWEYTKLTSGVDLSHFHAAAKTIRMNNNSECAFCTLGPPPDSILNIPPPPIPSFLQQESDYTPKEDDVPLLEHINTVPCKPTCEWRSEGVQYIEVPQQGTLLDDTWIMILISSCVGVIFVGIVLAVLMVRCKITRRNKNGVISTSTDSSTLQAKDGGITNDAVLYPCTTESLQDSRVMWATLTPRGTTRHYLEDHTYETIGSGQYNPKRSLTSSPTEHTYSEPPISSPIQHHSHDDKAFDNTAFVDYEEPMSVKSEYYQLDDVLEPCDPNEISCIFSLPRGNLRPRVSSPTRIENPNLPPLNLYPHKQNSRKNSTNQHNPDCSILRSSIGSSSYVPTL